jgi:hypothetical protein
MKDLSSIPTPISEREKFVAYGGKISHPQHWVDVVSLEVAEQLERERAVLINALKIAREYIDEKLDETRIAYGNRLMHKQKAIESDLKIADDAISLIDKAPDLSGDAKSFESNSAESPTEAKS